MNQVKPCRAARFSRLGKFKPFRPAKSLRQLFSAPRAFRIWSSVLLLALFDTPAQAKDLSNPSGPLLHPPSYEECLQAAKPVVTRKDIYRDGWIDLNKNGKKDIYEDPSQPVDKRVDDLLAQMTLEEKTCQTATLYGYQRVLKDYLPTTAWPTSFWKDGVANIDEQLTGFPYYEKKDLPGLEYLWPPAKHAWALNEIQRFFIEDTRLGVPAEFTDEGLRGADHYKATGFPTQLGLGATWNRALIRQIGQVTGREAFVLGFNNIYAPVMDVLRDPRWGRSEESYGEDPFLVAELGAQMVLGLQGEKVVATMKHFCVYSNNKGAREDLARTDPQVSPREMEMIHLWPYERVIRAANPLGVMCSYNDYDGVPIITSQYFLTEVLRKRMGFKGYVVSDSGAVEYLGFKHAVAPTYKDGVRQSIMAGLDVRTNFDPPEIYINPLRELVQEGKVPMSVLDERVRSVLRVKFWEGLFDHPYRQLTNANESIMTPANLVVAQQASRECLVLLKNDGRLLPLDEKKIKTIAICGPNADNVDYAKGHYGPLNPEVSTLRGALEKRFAGKAKVLYARGCDFFDAKWPDTEIMREPPTPEEQAEIDQAVANARQADVAIVVVGDQPCGLPRIRSTVGESRSRTGLDLTGRQDDLIRAVAATGKPTIVVNISGRPVALNWADRVSPAIIQAFFPGVFGGDALADTLFGDYTPGGKLACTIPKTSGQLPLNIPTKPEANFEPSKPDRVNVAGVLWPFGFGLSYTSFEYRDLKVEPETSATNQNVTISFTVANTGGWAGDEIPQLYVRQKISSVTTWEKRLCGFERIHLEPCRSKTVTMTITPDELAILNREMQRVVEPVEFKVMVGASSANIQLEGEFSKTP